MQIEPLDSGRPTILIVDDTPANLDVIVKALEHDGVRVVVAQDGEEGLRRATFVHPDLILLDIMLPGIDGFEVCRRLQEDECTRAIPVIFMTALLDIENKVAAFRAGAVDYVTKPFQIDEVTARVRTHLNLRNMQTMLAERNACLQREIEERKVAERRLQDYREGLELLVAERTAALRESEQRLEESLVRLRELSAHREQARDEERMHIARELHDELGQALTALRMKIALLRVEFGQDNPALTHHVGKVNELIDRTIGVVRGVSSALRPATLDMGVVPALEWLVKEFRARSDIDCELVVPEPSLGLDDGIELAIFRVAQESLTNVTRHARASSVRMTLQASDNQCLLEVRDDGCGFVPDGVERGKFGLVGMRERVEMLGGEFSISSAPGEGTSLSVRLPVASPLEIR
ncbi:response regulator [Massilia sp. TW-1]|uniref:Oxygen sensor histidine kinase NreB n=1 Tax=Telluria antibiotica TaxID=2717319 RepID=A0ABX0PIT3_9BURK|nr:response regulator [Telluria antibiotica]NIA57353.1 response regulator [Telluria antibiotica]